MNAKEWMLNDLKIDNIVNNQESINDLFTDNPYNYMERYSNYKNRELQSKILYFRNLIKNDLSVNEGGVVTIYKDFNDNLELLEAYDEHFNLTTERLNNKL